MFKRIGCIIISIILLITSTGCGDSSETDDNIYAITVGIDKGSYNKVIITIQYPTYKSGGPGGGASQGGGGGDANVHSIEAPGVLEGINLLNMAISRRVSLKHIKMLVISEKIAREGVAQYIAPFSRYREPRRAMAVVITNGNAVDFIKENKSNIGTSITKSIELMETQSHTTGFFPDTKFYEFYEGIFNNYGQGIATYAGVNNFNRLILNGTEQNSPVIINPDYSPGNLPRIGVAKREFVGTAVFNGDKMVGSLNPWETRYLLLITGKFDRGIFGVYDRLENESKIVSFELKLARKPKIKCKFENNKPVINIDLYLEGEIAGIQSRVNYADLNLIENLNSQIENYLEKDIRKTIEKTQKKYKSDVFAFGEEFAGYFPTIQQWEKYNWLKHYEEAKINLSVKVDIRRTGIRTRTSHIFSNQGKR